MSEIDGISILMNCYNSEKYLGETLESLFKQTYTDWELVFVDNCSTDNSKNIIEQYINDPRVLYITTPHHMSLGEARDFGLNYCQKPFICFLDTDDLWHPQKLEKQLAFIKKHPNALLCYSGCYFIDENSKTTSSLDLSYKNGRLLENNLANYEVNIPTLMIRKDSLNLLEKPYFDPSLKFAEDYNLVMRILSCGPAACYDENLVYYRKTSGSLTNNTIHLWGPELEYTLNILYQAGNLEGISERALELCRAKINYYKALSLIAEQNYAKARSILREYHSASYKYLILYLLSYIPPAWNLIHYLKNANVGWWH